ncbi:MAG: outer membrane protein assembly factor BamA [Longimonas sp.]|uniref:outer membrane protein assembly factor BamA n=1 Tax=Longimonas sp. TaxID=2039626 RepID=UPI0039760CB7
MALLLLFVGGLAGPAYGQVEPDPMPTPEPEPTPMPEEGPPPEGAAPMTEQTTLTVSSVRVEGAEDRARDLVLQTSGINEGQEIQLPRSEAIAEAVRAVYDLRLFSDVRIYQEERDDSTVGLVIEVTPEPRLGELRLQGMDRSDRRDVESELPLLLGRPVRQSDIERSVQIIQDHYAEDGYLNAEVNVVRNTMSSGQVRLVLQVDRGEKVKIDEIVFEGNEAFSDRRLRKQFEENKAKSWWRFWRNATFDPDVLEDDLDAVIDYYGENGYYDARITGHEIRETDDEDIVVAASVEEGHQYYVRSVEWEGNTVYSDEALANRLGFEEGDVFNSRRLDENLQGNREGSDVAGLYMDRGYLQFNAQPSIRVVGEDSLDIDIDIREGDTYDFGNITVAGNTKTKDHVVRRELFTVPGQTFSRSAIQESIRRLMQLNYFSQESLGEGPALDVDDEEQQVNLTYNLEEVGSDQLELSGTWGRFGLVLQLGFQFNNFSTQSMFDGSAWRPLPSGDGQRLGINVRTNGTFFQSYSLSFTEPWFRGRPNPIGGSVSFTQFSREPVSISNNRSRDGTFTQISSNLFFERRLSWPDDNFNLSFGVGYQYWRNDRGLLSSLPEGVNQTVTYNQALTRNSLDNPMFPREGSKIRLSAEVAPPIGDLVQYHKWRFNTDWNIPIGERFSVSVGTRFGYIGSITGEDVAFERFEVGGTLFDFSGYQFGTEPVPMRGYPARVIGPRETVRGQVSPVGGRILNKYTSEFRVKAVESQQLQAAPYLYLDAANTWDSFQTYNPSSLYRSAGVGVKLFLPIVGMIEFNYGYNFDTFVPFQQSEDGMPGWRFQFSLGQGGQQQQQ